MSATQSRRAPSQLAFPLVLCVLFVELAGALSPALASSLRPLVALGAWPSLAFLAGQFDRRQRGGLLAQLLAPLGLLAALSLSSAAASAVAHSTVNLAGLTLWALPALALWRLVARVLDRTRAPLVVSVALAVVAAAAGTPTIAWLACLFPFYLWGKVQPKRREPPSSWWPPLVALGVLGWSVGTSLPDSASAVAWWLARAAVIQWGLSAAPSIRRRRWMPRRAGAVTALWVSAPVIAVVSGLGWAPPTWQLAIATIVLGLLLATGAARAVTAWFVEWCHWLAAHGSAFDVSVIRWANVRGRRLARSVSRRGVAVRARFVTSSTILTCALWAMLLLLAGEWAAGVHESPANFPLEHPRPAAIAVVAIAAVLVVIDSIKVLSIAARPAAALAVVVLGLINREKIQYLSVPLYTSDFELADHVWALLPALISAHPEVIVLVAAALAAVAWAFISSRRVLASRWKAPPKGLAAIAIVLLVWLGDPSRRRNSVEAAGLLNATWDPIANARTNGFLLTFALSERTEGHPAPPFPGDEVLGTLLERTASPAGSAAGLDLVMVMSESLWDVEKLSAVEFTPAPMPTLRERSGSLFSPSIGGGTANVEFEALTGFSTAFLPPNTVPYQHVVYRRVPSLLWALKAEGYQTLALHPYHRWFWRREQVYEHLGFDRFIALDEMPNAALRGPYTSDDAMVDELLSRLRQADRPTALFAVSMQNHGPYEANRYSPPRLEVRGKLSDENRAMLQTYVEGVLDANLALGRLMQELRQRPRPTLLVFFGDHAPSLGGKHEVYVEGGAITSDDPLVLSDYVSLHRTPLLIWRSDTNEIIPMPQVSPSMLPSIVCELMQVDHPFYTRFLSRVRQDFDVVERRALHATNGGWSMVQSAVDEEPILKIFHALQHDLLFGPGLGLARLFPELAPLASAP